MKESIQRLGRDAKMHSTMNMWSNFAGVITFLGNNAWDIVVTSVAFLATIFTSIATCSFWMGAKSRQLEAMNQNITNLTEEVGSLRTSNNQVLQVVAAMSGQTVDGFKWRIKNQGE